MNRRNFILCRATSGGKVVEVSCKTLYMQIMDIQTANSVSRCGIRDEEDSFWATDEPPLYFETVSIESLFSDLQSQVNSSKRIRLLDTNWILTEVLREKIETLLANFRELGGEVEIVNNVNQLNTVIN